MIKDRRQADDDVDILDDEERPGYWLLPEPPCLALSGALDPDPASPAGIRLAEEIRNDHEMLKRRNQEGEETKVLSTAAVEEEAMQQPQYIGCEHPFCYGGVESAVMKNCKDEEKKALMRVELAGIGIEYGDNAALERGFPRFFELYIKLFTTRDSAFHGLYGIYGSDTNKGMGAPGSLPTDNNLTAARKLYNDLIREQDPTFKLPNKPDLMPEVWEKVERLMTGNPKVTKCRAHGCTKHFDSNRGELVCSEKCKEKHQAANGGLVCTTCAKPIVKRHPDRYAIGQAFYNPEDRSWYPAGLLEMSETEIRAEFAFGESRRNSVNSADPCDERVAFVMETKRKKNPIMFCSGECEGAWRDKLICKKCGWEEGKDEGACKQGGKKRKSGKGGKGGMGGMGVDRTPDAPDAVTRSLQKSFPNLDELPKSSSSTEFERFTKAKLWKQQKSCAQCTGFMLPRMPVRVA